jgi:hypothetical protein
MDTARHRCLCRAGTLRTDKVARRSAADTAHRYRFQSVGD